MKAKDAMILWDSKRVPSVKVVALGRDDPRYTYSGGAAYTAWRTASGKELAQWMLGDFMRLTVECGLPAKEVHGAFMSIDEYRAALNVPERLILDPKRIA